MRRVLSGVALVAWYVAAFVRANLQVALAGLRPDSGLSPVVLDLPVELRGWRLALLANMVTLTPGTFTIDVPEDESYLVIHTLWGHEREAVIAEVLELQSRLQEVLT